MASNQYTAIPGSEREPMRGATKAGSCDPNEQVSVTLVLRQRPSSEKLESLDALVERGERLTRDEYAARYGADPEDVKRIETFARAYGLTVSEVNIGAKTMVLSGTAQALCRAFQVDLARYEYPGGAYRGHTGAVYVPSDLKDVVRNVLGLDNRPQARPHCRILQSVRPGAASAAVSYTPLQVAQLYDFPTGVNGQGET
ncbi:MAG: protease pro-enzyme activation domain-containing protein, partial [Candidatus Dormibacteraceae bacterium]